MKVVIVGGVAGGASAAARLRRLDETAQIVVLERSGYVSYANCGLPYYVGDVIQEAGALSVQTPQSLAARSPSTCAYTAKLRPSIQRARPFPCARWIAAKPMRKATIS